MFAIVLALFAASWLSSIAGATSTLTQAPPVSARLDLVDGSLSDGRVIQMVLTVSSTSDANISVELVLPGAVRLTAGSLTAKAEMKAAEKWQQEFAVEAASDGLYDVLAIVDAELADSTDFHAEATLLLNVQNEMVTAIQPSEFDVSDASDPVNHQFEDVSLLPVTEGDVSLVEEIAETSSSLESEPQATFELEPTQRADLERNGGDLQVDFDTVLIVPQELREPVRQALVQDRLMLPADYRFTVTSFRMAGNWGEVFVVPSRIVEARWNTDISADEVLELVASLGADSNWTACIRNSKCFDDIKGEIPLEFSDYSRQETDQSRQVEAVTYLFPWTKGQRWYKTQGWHSGNAIDFQPVVRSNPPIDLAVIAAAAGRVTETCNDGTQSILDIQDADSSTARYVHLASNSIRRDLLGKQVVRGQFLGLLYNPGSAFNTTCGSGTAVHLHFVLPRRDMTIDGLSANSVANSAYATQYTSSNVRINGEDLIVVDIWSTTSPLRIGEWETIQFRIKNQGSGTINRRFYTKLWIGTTQIGYWYNDSLAPGQTSVGTTQVRVNVRGSYVMKAAVDTTNVVAETNESNNTRLETWIWN